MEGHPPRSLAPEEHTTLQSASISHPTLPSAALFASPPSTYPPSPFPPSPGLGRIPLSPLITPFATGSSLDELPSLMPLISTPSSNTTPLSEVITQPSASSLPGTSQPSPSLGTAPSSKPSPFQPVEPPRAPRSAPNSPRRESNAAGFSRSASPSRLLAPNADLKSATAPVAAPLSSAPYVGSFPLFQYHSIVKETPTPKPQLTFHNLTNLHMDPALQRIMKVQ